MASSAIEAQKRTDPSAGVGLDNIHHAASKKLYHQMTESLWEYVAKKPTPPGLETFYMTFVKPLEGKINQLRLAQVALACTADMNPKLKAEFLHQLASDTLTDPPARLLVVIHQAGLDLGEKDLPAARAKLDGAKETLDGLLGVENVIHSAYYRVDSGYWAAKDSPADFYRSALLFLSYTPPEALGPGEAAKWAFDISVSALVGKNVYNFMEILSHPVFPALQASSNAWIAELLAAFNAGDLPAYKRLAKTYKAQMSGVKALKGADKLLSEKISILALMELVFHRPAEDRTTSFADAAKATELSVNDVELMVMKAFALGLFKGSIDQVAQTIAITWVQPRVLGKDQIRSLKDRMNDWIAGVSETSRFFETQTTDFTA